jgi:hypothetical protein
MANGMFKMKMDINRHGPRLMPNNCQNLDPPYFLLPTTFNESFDKTGNITLAKIVAHFT